MTIKINKITARFLNKKIWLSLFIAFITAACVQTKTLVSNADEYLVHVQRPLYCGTFSLFTYYNKNNQTVLNSTLTAAGNQLYDSLIRSRAKKMNFQQTAIVQDTASAMLLGKEFTAIINHASKNESIKTYKAGAVFSELTKNQFNDHFIFFVPADYNRSPENYMHEMTHPGPKGKDGNYDIISSTVASVLLSGLMGSAVVVNVNNNFPSAYGSNCHLIVYNKKTDRVSLYRQQFFTNDYVSPLNNRYLNKQVDYLLKEYL